MNKKWLKFSLFILIILTTVVFTSTVVLGWSYTDFGTKDSGSDRGSAQILDLSENIVSILKPVGYILGVVIVFALAISTSSSMRSSRRSMISPASSTM